MLGHLQLNKNLASCRVRGGNRDDPHLGVDRSDQLRALEPCRNGRGREHRDAAVRRRVGSGRPRRDLHRPRRRRRLPGVGAAYGSHRQRGTAGPRGAGMLHRNGARPREDNRDGKRVSHRARAHLIERLLDAGPTLVEIHPSKVAAARDRCRAAGEAGDRGREERAMSVREATRPPGPVRCWNLPRAWSSRWTSWSCSRRRPTPSAAPSRPPRAGPPRPRGLGRPPGWRTAPRFALVDRLDGWSDHVFPGVRRSGWSPAQTSGSTASSRRSKCPDWTKSSQGRRARPASTQSRSSCSRWSPGRGLTLPRADGRAGSRLRARACQRTIDQQGQDIIDASPHRWSWPCSPRRTESNLFVAAAGEAAALTGPRVPRLIPATGVAAIEHIPDRRDDRPGNHPATKGS